jgi:acetoacetate decarboxylase
MNFSDRIADAGHHLVDDVNRLRQLVRPGDLMYRDAHYLTATVQVDPCAMRRFLPWGVSLAAPPRADLFCAYFPDNSLSFAYREAGLFVHVRAGLRTGIHCPWMIVDDDVALIVGREALGYPKKLGHISWDHQGSHISAHAERRGTGLVHMEAELGEILTGAPPFLGRPHRNVVGFIGLSLPWLIAFTPREYPIETRRVDLSLKVDGSDRDPLHEMGLGAVEQARLHRVDLGAGQLAIPPIPLRPLINPLYLVRQLRPRVL